MEFTTCLGLHSQATRLLGKEPTAGEVSSITPGRTGMAPTRSVGPGQGDLDTGSPAEADLPVHHIALRQPTAEASVLG